MTKTIWETSCSLCNRYCLELEEESDGEVYFVSNCCYSDVCYEEVGYILSGQTRLGAN